MKQNTWERLKQEYDELNERIVEIEAELKYGDVLVSNQYIFMLGYKQNLELRIALETEKRRQFATGKK